MISNNIKRLEYGDWIFKGNNTTMTMLDMKIQIDASLRNIGKVFNVSHETVNLRFADLRKKYPELWQDAKSKRQFYENFMDLWNDELTIAEIAQKLFISIGQARKLEHKLISREARKYRIFVPRRANNLSHSLFGYQFNPGNEFESFVKQLFKKNLREPEFESMAEYYFNGADAPQKARFERHKLIQKVKQEFNYDDLLERNVLCRNQEM